MLGSGRRTKRKGRAPCSTPMGMYSQATGNRRERREKESISTVQVSSPALPVLN